MPKGIEIKNRKNISINLSSNVFDLLARSVEMIKTVIYSAINKFDFLIIRLKVLNKLLLVMTRQ